LTGVGEDGLESTISRHTQRLVYTRHFTDVNIWRVQVLSPHGKISSPMKLISSTRADGHAQFSPDGKKVVFDSNQSGSYEIWICDSDGSNQQQLTSLGRYNGAPRWSPDGERIAFQSDLREQSVIFVASVNGGKPKQVTSSPAADYVPSWSRDGKWIYFASNRSGEYQVWKVLVDGGEAHKVTRKGGFEAAESPDSQWVYYTKVDGATGGLWRMPRNGGEETQVLESVDKQAFAIVSEGIYFIARPDSAGRYSIQFFDFARKSIRSIFTIESKMDPYLSVLSVSPNGRWILYSQIDQEGSDLMLVENFR
jgi:Tol biopolymer transport system component